MSRQKSRILNSEIEDAANSYSRIRDMPTEDIEEEIRRLDKQIIRDNQINTIRNDGSFGSKTPKGTNLRVKRMYLLQEYVKRTGKVYFR